MTVTLVIFIIGSLFLLLLAIGIIFINWNAIAGLFSNENDMKEEKEVEVKGEDIKFTIYDCHGANFKKIFNDPKYNQSCPNDSDFVWNPNKSCDRDELIKLRAEGEFGSNEGCPEGYSMIEGPELTGQKCLNDKNQWGFKCYQRRNYYNYNPKTDRHDNRKGIDCCLGKVSATECSGGFCPGSAVCNNILKNICDKKYYQDEAKCLEFCSKTQSGFPIQLPVQKQIDAAKDLGIYNVIIERK